MVVGAGIAGIQASLDLAESGFYVHLVDKSPTIGGIMPQLDKTFPTNDCSMCIVSPKLVECGRHLNINKITNSEVSRLEGEPGHFKVELVNHPRYIDLEKCTGCGVCKQHCPVTAVNEFNEGLNRRAATYIRYPQAVPLAYAIDRKTCIGCGLCEKMCLAKAIVYDQEERKTEIEVGAVVLALGNEVFNPSNFEAYSYALHPNVVTSLEFERILAPPVLSRATWSVLPTMRNRKRSPGFNVWGPGTSIIAITVIVRLFAACMPSRKRSLPRNTARILWIRPSFSWICVPMARTSKNIITGPRTNGGFALSVPGSTRVDPDPETDNLLIQYVRRTGKS